jgi:DNA-directed RNA polymerase alpha subunit
LITAKNKTHTSRYTVERYERSTNELVAVYLNTVEAAYKLKVHVDMIRTLCSNKRRAAADFILKYGEKVLQPKNVVYPPYEVLPLKRVEVDNESQYARKKEEKRLQREIERLEAIEERRLEDERQALAIQQERQQRLESKDATNIRIDDLFHLLSVRTRNCLGRAGIITLGELIQYERKDLMYIRNFGIKCLSEIEELLSDKSLSLLQQIEKEKQTLTKTKPSNEALNIRIAYVNDVCYTWVSVRTINCLRRAGIKTIGDLLKFREKDLMYLRNFGVTCLNEVVKLLDEFNLKLR